MVGNELHEHTLASQDSQTVPGVHDAGVIVVKSDVVVVDVGESGALVYGVVEVGVDDSGELVYGVVELEVVD